MSGARFVAGVADAGVEPAARYFAGSFTSSSFLYSVGRSPFTFCYAVGFNDSDRLSTLVLLFFVVLMVQKAMMNQQQHHLLKPDLSMRFSRRRYPHPSP